MQSGRTTRLSQTGESDHEDTSHQNDPEKQPVYDDSFSNAAAGEQPIKDPNIVDWEGPGDPENPMNWPLKQKVTAIGVVSVLAFLS